MCNLQNCVDQRLYGQSLGIFYFFLNRYCLKEIGVFIVHLLPW